jgi:hypothetical protein
MVRSVLRTYLLHFKPTAGCQISTLIFRLEGGALYICHTKLPTDDKVLNQLVLPGPLTDLLSTWVGFRTSSPGDNISILDCGDNTSIIDRGDNTSILNRWDNPSIIDRA